MKQAQLTAALLMALHVSAFAASAGAPLASHILTYEQYGQTAHDIPYTLRIESSVGALLLIGVEHTKDPRNAQISLINREWKKFKPATAYFEGNGWNLIYDYAKNISEYGEPGLVRMLAIQHQVPVAAIEPDLANEIMSLKKSWNDEQIKLFYTLRMYTQNASRDETANAEMVLGYLASGLPQNPGVKGPPFTLDELSQATQTYLGIADWRKVEADWFSPNRSGRVTNEIAQASGRFRDEYMLDVLIRRVKQGDRVFAVLGFDHVIMLEPALRKALQQ